MADPTPQQAALRPEVVPELSVRRGRAAIAFYEAAFGAVEVYRVGGTDEHEAVVAQLMVGDASFWVADESPDHGQHSPESLGGATTRLLLVVDDPEGMLRRAVAAGATEVYPVRREHGWLLGRVADPFGHHWEIGRPLGPWPPTVAGPRGRGETPRDVAAPTASGSDNCEQPPVFRPGGVSYLRIPAPDPRRSAAFYRAVFAWSVREEEASAAFEDATGHIIGHLVADVPVAGDAGVIPYVYVRSVDETVARVAPNGGGIVRPPYPEGDLWVATVRDPAGNVFGVWQRGPRSPSEEPASGS